jgi:hypothetical protein
LSATSLAQLIFKHNYRIQGEAMTALKEMACSQWFVAQDLRGPQTLRSAEQSLPLLPEYTDRVEVKSRSRRAVPRAGHAMEKRTANMAYHKLTDIVQRMVLTHGKKLRRTATVPHGGGPRTARGLWSGATARENPMFTQEYIDIGPKGEMRVDLGACAKLRPAAGHAPDDNAGPDGSVLVRVTGVFLEEQPRGRRAMWACTVRHYLSGGAAALAGVAVAGDEVVLGNRDVIVGAHELDRLHSPSALPPQASPPGHPGTPFCHRGLDEDGTVRSLK